MHLARIQATRGRPGSHRRADYLPALVRSEQRRAASRPVAHRHPAGRSAARSLLHALAREPAARAAGGSGPRHKAVKVSVHMPAFNHGPYIAQALESVLAQQVPFDYEIVVGEDCSTDDTRAIAVDYARRFPDRIQLLLHERNLGIFENDQRILAACRGEYIAWLESDDYWTSPVKLHKQVALLDAHTEFSAVF